MQENIKVEDVKKLTGKVAEFQEYNGWTDPTFERRDREIYIKGTPYIVFKKELEKLYVLKTKIAEAGEDKNQLLSLYKEEIVFIKDFMARLKEYKNFYKGHQLNIITNWEVDRVNILNNLQSRAAKILNLHAELIKPEEKYSSVGKKTNFLVSIYQAVKLRRFLGSVVKQTVK